jgi:anaerobic magnesium-protoporphyrin IX monomethyl ester cyclase
MKVALVFPRFKYPSGDPPLGLGYLAASLIKETDAELNVFDATFARSREKFAAELTREPFDLMGFSVMTTQIDDALFLARAVKHRHPAVKIVFGGPHPTLLPGKVLASPEVDAAVIGEGERTLVELVNAGNVFDKVRGIMYRRDGTVVRTEERGWITDLDSLPFPARERLPMKRYLDSWFQLDSVSPRLTGTNILASRGCPYACSYCQPTLNTLFGKKTRRRSPENILAELAELKDKLNINAFLFADDTFNLDREWLRRFCEKLSASRLGLVWGCNIRANLARPDDLAMMREAGLRKILMVIESANERVLDEVYQKGITLEQVREGVEAAHRLGLKIQGYFMLGAPGETACDLRATLRLARTLPLDDATFSLTTPLPGTLLYDKTAASVSLPITQFDYYKRYAYGNAFGLSSWKLRFYKRLAYASFYLSPGRILSTLGILLNPARALKTLMKLKRL